MPKIKPELISGFKDYLPQEMIPRQKMLDTIRNIFENFGFEPLDTPIIEKFDVLTGNDKNFNMNLFRTGIVKGVGEPLPDFGAEMALRFDLTVPLARVLAYNLDLPKPFKRYQVGYVFRGEKAQRGRFRGFLQFDADVVGSSTMMADTEIIQLIYAVMRALQIDNFVVRVNNRKILNGLAELANFDKPVERRKEVFRILDKLEKNSWSKLKKELQAKPKNKLDKTAPNLSVTSIKIVEDFLNLGAKKNSQAILLALKKIFKKSSVGRQGVEELEEIIDNLEKINLPQKNWAIDLSIARGLDYYTGPVFETTLTDLPTIGSVFSGGRYDNLVSRFSRATLPATGASIGVDRLFAALKILKKIKPQKSICEVIILNLDKKLKSDYLQIAKELRQSKINTQIYIGEDLSFNAQFSYALNQEIPIILILGEKEKQANIVNIKNTRTREQNPVDRDKIVKYIKKILADF